MAIMKFFPHSLDDSFIARGIPTDLPTPGKTFFVSNNAALLSGETTESDANTGGFFDPFATIDGAIGNCVANRGDIIYVRPGHVETVTAASGIALDVAGVAIIGIGTGSNRPTVNFTTATTASMRVSAANCTVAGILFTGSIDALINPIHITAADFALLGCEYRDVTGNAVRAILTSAAATRLLIKGHYHFGAAAGDVSVPFSAIALVGVDQATIEDCVLRGSFVSITGATIETLTTASTNLIIRRCILSNLETDEPVLIGGDAIANTTGFVSEIFARLGEEEAGQVLASMTASKMVYSTSILISGGDNDLAIIVPKTATTG